MSRDRAAVWLLLPAGLWLAVAILVPLLLLLGVSLRSLGPLQPGEAVWTLAQYQAALGSAAYRIQLWRALQLAAEVTALCLLLGVPAGLALARAVGDRWREALLLLLVLPFWTNALIRLAAWDLLLPWIGIREGYAALLLGLVHGYLPYAILTSHLAFAAIDPALPMAAASLGASRLRILWRIQLPLAAPGILAGAVLILVPVTGSFLEPRLLGGREAAMIGIAIEAQISQTGNWPLASALSMLLLAVMALVTLPLLWFGRRAAGGAATA